MSLGDEGLQLRTRHSRDAQARALHDAVVEESTRSIATLVVSFLVLAEFMCLLDDDRFEGDLGTLILATNAPAMPSARSAQQMAYDSESQRIVLFGGGFADTWAYDVRNNNWQNMNPPNLPPARYSPGMAYDSKADRMVLFGGYDAGIVHTLNDTWTYDFNTNTWTELTPPGSPPARTGGQLVYDLKLDRLILFGGHADASGNYLAKNDTWIFDLGSNTWTQVVTTVSPTLRAFPIMQYDVKSNRVVLFGGETEPSSLPDDQTWSYDPANETWTRMTPSVAPAARFGAAGAYDLRTGKVLVFGGGPCAGCNDTWAYDFDADTWTKISTASSPSDRLTAMAYDGSSDRTVLFGGLWPWPNGVNNQETWILDPNNKTWTMVLPDIVNPTIAVTSPINGASLASRQVNVTGTASDNIGVAKVEVSTDNLYWSMANGTTAWYSVLSLTKGENTIYARVTDTSGNSFVTEIHVTVASSGFPIWVWLVAALAIAIVVGAAYLAMRRRRKAN